MKKMKKENKRENWSTIFDPNRKDKYRLPFYHFVLLSLLNPRTEILSELKKLRFLPKILVLLFIYFVGIILFFTGAFISTIKFIIKRIWAGIKFTINFLIFKDKENDHSS